MLSQYLTLSSDKIGKCKIEQKVGRQGHRRVKSERVMFLPVLLLSLSMSQSVLCIEYDKIVKITTTTGDDLESGMNLSEGSSIDLEVFGHYGGSECRILDLRHKETHGEGDFTEGQKDEFVGGDLQDCDGHTVTWYPGSVSKVRVYHFGTDGWGVRGMAVTFDDSSYVSCGPDTTVYVTDREYVDLMC